MEGRRAPQKAAQTGAVFSQTMSGRLTQDMTSHSTHWGNFWKVKTKWARRYPWYGKAAAQGNSCAAYRLGKLYLTGQGVKQDWEQAWAYFYESAEQGNEYADFFPEHFD